MNKTKNFMLRYFIYTISLIFVLIILWLTISDFWQLSKIGSLYNYSQNNYLSCAVILPKNEMFWQQFLDEFDQFAQSQQILTDTIFYTNKSEEIFGIKLALFSKFDSVIICNVFQDKEINSYIQKLIDNKTKVILLLKSFDKFKKVASIGFNYYQKGEIVGKNIYNLAQKNGLDKITIAVVTNNINQKIAYNEEISGISNFLKSKNCKFKVDVYTIEYGTYKSSNLLKSILQKNEYNCFYTTEELETFAFIDGFVSLSIPKNFIFIGAGDDSRLLRYRDENLIDCLIIPNYDELAIRAVLAINDMMKNKLENFHIPTSIIVK